jgi:hypothetical protein
MPCGLVGRYQHSKKHTVSTFRALSQPSPPFPFMRTPYWPRQSLPLSSTMLGQFSSSLLLLLTLYELPLPNTHTSAMKMETVCFSETLTSTYGSTWHHNPGEQHRNLCRHENLKSFLLTVFFVTKMITIKSPFNVCLGDSGLNSKLR